MITLDDLIYTYPHATMQFSCHIACGERVAILGPSGAGKSTLLSLIAGFLRATQGQLLLNGQEHRLTPPSARPVSMLFQENNLFPHLNIEQNIGLGLDPGLRLNPQQTQQLAAMTTQMGLNECLARLPAQLSGGQRQRAALARCLLRQQPILLLDEPFSALDPALRSEMLQLLEQICCQQHLTLLMVSHHLDDVAKVAPRTLVIANNTIVYNGYTQDVLSGKAPIATLLGR